MGHSVALAGLNPPASAATPELRRQWLARQTDEALAGAIAQMALELRGQLAPVLSPWSSLVGVPSGELVASPFGARACALGTSLGVVACHHELRAPVRCHQDDSALFTTEHAIWHAGVFQVGKYQSFFQDEPLIDFNPNHSARWTSHEMLHRSIGHFWRHGMTAFECYLGARLNELVPVVHWYGPDLVARLDELDFDRHRDARIPAAPLERARWWSESPEALRDRVSSCIHHLRHGLERFEHELSAVRREAVLGSLHPVHLLPYPELDASSDALAYAAQHTARLTQPGVHWLHENVLGLGRDFAGSPSALAHRVESTFDAMLFGPISLDLHLAGQRAQGRILWDALRRTTAVKCPRSLFPHAPSLRAALDRAWAGDGTEARRLLGTLPSRGSAKRALQQGLRAHATSRTLAAHDQLEAGLRSLSPGALQLMRRSTRLATVQHLAGHDALWQRGPLAERITQIPNLWSHPALSALAQLETAISCASWRDDAIERLFAPPRQSSTGWLLKSRAFTLLRLDWEVTALHDSLSREAGELSPPFEQPSLVLVGRFWDGVSLVPIDSAVASWWEALDPAAPPTWVQGKRALQTALRSHAPEAPIGAMDWLKTLVKAGAVAFVPRPAEQN